jgi:hypothetical protein
MRKVAVGIVVATVVLAGCTGPQPQPSKTSSQWPAGAADVGLTVTPSKASYAKGEPVQLTVVVTNRRSTACRLDRIPDGSLTILALSRDGTAVVPGLTTATFVDGFATFVQGNLVEVAPGASLTQTLVSTPDPTGDDESALPTSTTDVADQGALEYWPVDQPGDYAVSVGYTLAAPPTDPNAACLASGTAADARFTVGG